MYKILLNFHKNIIIFIWKFYNWELKRIKKDIKTNIQRYEKYHWKYYWDEF